MDTVRDVVHDFLLRNGMTTIFGNPGSNELPFLTGLPDGIRYVLGLHEGAVVSMADGYAQASGRPVLVNLHAASGSGNGMGALTNAVAARTPLVLMAGQQVRSAIGLEANLATTEATTLMRPLVGFAAEPACATDVPRTIAHAVYEAQLHRRPSYVSVPYDDWDSGADDNADLLLRRTVASVSVPDEAAVAALAQRLSAARRPALVLGGDIDTQGGFDAAVALAEQLAADVFAAPSLFRLPFPNRHPLFRGVLPAGIVPIAERLDGHDLVLVLGAPVFRYHENLPGRYLPDGVDLVQVTDDPSATSRAPMGEALVTDPVAMLRRLSAALAPRAAMEQTSEPPAAPSGSGGLHPEQVFAALRDTQPSDTAYVVESTSTNAAWWRQMDLRRPGSYYFPAAGGLGFGLPATVGVALGAPDRPVVGVIGDGSANYGITALWTAAQLGVPATFVILRNGTYGALRWFAGLLGTPDVPGLDVPGLDFAPIAQGYGVPATTATSVDQLRDLLADPPTGPRLIQVDTLLTTPNA